MAVEGMEVGWAEGWGEAVTVVEETGEGKEVGLVEVATAEEAKEEGAVVERVAVKAGAKAEETEAG